MTPRPGAVLPGRLHFLIGGDPARWRRDVVCHGELVQEEVLPGIDLRWHGDPTRLEYDFVVAPGADPSAIRVRWQGLGGEGLHQQAPRAWEEDPEGRHPVTVGLERRPDGCEGFAVEGWSGRHPLIIDPVIAYGTYLGGTNGEAVRALARDAQGNLYLGGSTWSASFLYGGTGTRKGLWDLFVVKLDPTGTQALYTTFVGGTDAVGETEALLDLAVDSRGRAVVLGRTEVADFPTVNAFQPAFGGRVDAVAFALDPGGANLAWSTYLGGSDFEVDTDVRVGDGGLVVDAQDHVFACSVTRSTDFPTVTPSQGALAGTSDLFATHFDSSGQVVWSTYLGGFGSEGFGDLELSLGLPVVAGGSSGGWPTTQGAAYTTGAGFVSALDRSTQAMVWSTCFPVAPAGIAADAQGDLWLVGETTQGNVPTTPGAHQAFHGGSQQGHSRQAWCARLAPGGTALRFGTYYGRNDENDSFGDVVVDAHGHACAVGTVASHWTSTVEEGLVVKFDPLGFATVYEGRYGGINSNGESAVLRAPGSLWLAGTTSSATGVATAGALQGQAAGQQDGFLMRIEDAAGAIAKLAAAGTNVRGGTSLTMEVVLDGVAPAGGTPVALTSSDPTALQVPSAVTVPAGSATVDFRGTAGPANTNQSVTVTASALGSQQALGVIVGPGPRWRIESHPHPVSAGSIGLAINAHGHIAGWGTGGGFIVDDGGMRVVTPGRLMDLNDRGDAAGYVPYGSAFHLPSGGTQRSITPGEAYGLNAFGQVVGVGPGAFRWSVAGGLQALGTLGGAYSQAYDINATGQVTGSSDVASGAEHAFRFTDGAGMVDLGLPAGTSNSYGYAINDHGQVAGSASIGFFAGVLAFRYTDGAGLVALPPPAGMNHSEGLAIDTAGRVGGWVSVYNSAHRKKAALFDGSWRVIRDEISPEDAFRWNLLTVEDMNDRGEMVGVGLDRNNRGAETAFRLVPRFFEPYGRGSEGTDRIVTSLRGEGTPVSGNPIRLVVRGAPNALAGIVASGSSAQVTLPGGAPRLIGPEVWISPHLTLDGRGIAVLPVTLPNGMGPGSLFVQAVTLDTGSANGVYTTSNGIEMRVPY